MAVKVVSKMVAEAPTEIKAQSITQTIATLTIDRSKGEYVIVELQSNVTSVVVSNWPASGILGRVQLEVRNSGSFTISSGAWPTGTVWPEGIRPTITAGVGEVDLIVLMSTDGGTNIRGSIVGMNYS